METNEERWTLTEKEAAERIGVSHRHLVERRRDGTGPTYLDLGDGARAMVRYRVRDLEAWLDSHRKGGGESASEVDP